MYKIYEILFSVDCVKILFINDRGETQRRILFLKYDRCYKFIRSLMINHIVKEK